MKNLLLILVLSLFSVKGFAGSCPDGSEPIKSISADGTYFVYNCGGGNDNTNNAASEQINENIISPVSQGTYTHNNKYHSEPPFYFAYAKLLDTRMRIAKIQGKGEAFQISKLDGIPELNKLFKKKRVSEFPDKEKWGAKLYFDTVEISEKVGWIGQNNPSALVEDFISIDLDHDGDKDWLVFLYGFTQVKKDNSSEIYKNCGREGCVSGDIVFPVVAFLTDENGKAQGPKDAGQFFVSGNAPYVKNARMIRIADFNGDSIDDYIIAEAGWDNPPYSYKPSYQSHLFMSTGDKFKHVEFGILDKAHGITAGDIENDGDQDFIISYVDRSVIYINDGKGNFKNQGIIQIEHHTNYLELADLDSDGYLDLLIGTNGCSHAPSILRNNGSGSFSTFDLIQMPIKKANQCGGDPWSNDFSMIHHLIEFDDKFLLLTSNNHQGWGFSTLIKDGKNLRIMNSGKFKKENVSENHFPYKVMLDKDKVIIFDFNFEPYYFEFNHDTGELIQQLDNNGIVINEIALSSEEKVVLEEHGELEVVLTEENKSSPLFDGRYSFDVFRYSDDEDNQRVGSGFVNISNGKVIIEKDNRELKTGSTDLYDTFSGQINEKGKVSASMTLDVLNGKNVPESYEFNGSIKDKKMWGETAFKNSFKAFMLLEEAITINLAKPLESVKEVSEVSNAFDGSYSFTLDRFNSSEGSIDLGRGILEVKDGKISVAKKSRQLKTSSTSYYDTFEGQIDKQGNITSSFTVNALKGKGSPVPVNFSGRMNELQIKGKFDDYFEMIIQIKPIKSIEPAKKVGEAANSFDGSYAFMLTTESDNGIQNIGSAQFIIKDGKISVARKYRYLDTSAISTYDTFEGVIDKEGNINVSFEFNPIRYMVEPKTIKFSGSMDSLQLRGGFDEIKSWDNNTKKYVLDENFYPSSYDVIIDFKKENY